MPTLCDPMDCSLSGSSVHGYSPGKNTGVGSLSLLQGIFLTQELNQCLPHCRQILYQLSYQIYAVLCLVDHPCPILCDPMDCSPPGSFVHGDSPGKNTGVGCQVLLQGIFPAQGLNSGLPHRRWIPYQLNHQGSSRILEWVAYPFFRESSQPRCQIYIHRQMKYIPIYRQMKAKTLLSKIYDTQQKQL